jgi:gamma-glutamyltranspeptidase/glutathione hydrolase
VAEGGSAGFYQGAVARALLATSRAEGGLFDSADLEGHSSTWVEPLCARYRDVEAAELPPNGQGLTALVALNILERFDPVSATSALDWHRRIEAVKLAFADRDVFVADPDHVDVPVKALLDKGYAARRAALIGPRALPGAAPGLAPGDTTYLCTADSQGNLVSFIQSLFGGFGSGIACGDTGVLLQNRGAGFRLDPAHRNALAPGKRPFHTIAPGMLLRGGRPCCAFGVMGGDVQPQGHLAFVANLVDHGMNPQEALDRPRFRFLEGARVAIEAPELAVDEGGTLGDALAAWGHQVVPPGDADVGLFGGGQALLLGGDGVMAGGSDRRKDGCALGLD